MTPEKKSAMKTFDQLLAVAEEIGYPRYFAEDLGVHDRRTILSKDPEVFIEVFREAGTHLYLEDVISAPGFCDVLRDLLSAHPESRVYLFVRGELSEITETIPRIDRIRGVGEVEAVAL